MSMQIQNLNSAIRPLIVSDLGGVLLDTNTPAEQIQSETYRDLEAVLQQNNAKIWYTTGRYPKYLTHLQGKIPTPDFVISESGGRIYKNFPSASPSPLLDWENYLETLNYNAQTIEKEMSQLAKKYNFQFFSKSSYSGEYKPKFNFHIYINEENLSSETPKKKVIQIINELRDNLKEKTQFDALIYKRKNGQEWAVLFTPIGVNKNSAMEFLLQKSKIHDIEHTIVIGDDVLDLPLFKIDGRYMIAVGDDKSTFSQAIEHLQSLVPQNIFWIKNPERLPLTQILTHLKSILENFNKRN